ncbi:hypothetical protein Tco_0279257, partial [Tanacetum coccineum]
MLDAWIEPPTHENMLDKEVAGCVRCRKSGFPAFAQQTMDILPTGSGEVIDRMLNRKKSAFSFVFASFAPSEID